MSLACIDPFLLCLFVYDKICHIVFLTFTINEYGGSGNPSGQSLWCFFGWILLLLYKSPLPYKKVILCSN